MSLQRVLRRRQHTVCLAGVMALLGLLLASVDALPAAPPAGSPLARGEHPRLFLSAADLPGLKTRLATHYRTELQSFIDELDTKFGDSASTKTDWERKWGGVNYAFLGVLDPQSMSGFTARHTTAQYCAKAAEYAKTLLPDITANVNEYHGNLVTATAGPLNLPPAVVYDWCNSRLGQTDKIQFVNAFIDNFQLRKSPSRLMIDNTQTMEQHSALLILSFYNDALSGSYGGKTYGQWQAEMYDWFHDIWISQFVDTINYFYDAAGWHEGPSYGANSYVNAVFAVGAVSSALGIDYFGSMPYFRTYPVFLLANTKPLPEGAVFYNNRWGDVGGGKSTFDCKSAQLAIGTVKTSFPSYASLQKWQFDRLPHCATFPRHGGQWANAVFYSFLWGRQEVTSKSPSEVGLGLAQKLGQGEFVFRSGYGDPSDTFLAFWATDYIIKPGGHSHEHIGHFTLEKFGTLVVKAGNAKSPASEELVNDNGALFHNVVGVHNPTDGLDTYMTYDRGIGDSANDRYTSARYQPSGQNNVGVILAYDINNGRNYEYVAYDSSRAWLNKVSLSQRELVYLRGAANNEFVVLVDRMATGSAGYEKKWHIWTAAAPTFVNGSPVQERAGKWVSTNTDLMMVTNTYGGNGSHGRLFVKTVAPAGARVTVVGGPTNHYFEDTKGNPAPGTVVYPLNAEQENRISWGRIEVEPATPAQYDLFLHVLQFGDANTLSAMTDIHRLDGAGLIGARVGTTWAVAFNKVAGRLASGDMTMDRAGTYNLLFCDLTPGQTYVLSVGGAASELVASRSGTLFVSNVPVSANTRITLAASGTPPDTILPAPPRNLRLQ